jgi:hypothetical protein
MSEFKGTPAPWNDKDVHICRQDDAGLRLGFLNTHDDERRAQGLANARIIVAAPELLNALEGIMDDVLGNRAAINEERITSIRAAINKALGQ